MRALAFRINNTTLKPAYMLTEGDEALKSYVKDLFVSLIPKEQRDFACVIVDGANKNINEIIFAADSFVFGGDKKIVFVEGLNKKLSKEDIALLDGYFKNPNESAIIIFDNVDKNAQVLVNYAEIIECFKGTAQELYSYVFMKLRDNGFSMDSPVITQFVAYCNNDFGKINNELDKLMLYKQDEKKILKQDYENLTAIDLEIQVYDLTNALSRKNFEQAIDIFNKLKTTAGGNDGLRSLFRLMQSTYRKMLAILTSSLSDEETAQALRMSIAALNVNKSIMSVNKDRVDYIYKVKNTVEYLTKIEEQLMTFRINEENALNLAINKVIEIYNGK